SVSSVPCECPSRRRGVAKCLAAACAIPAPLHRGTTRARWKMLKTLLWLNLRAKQMVDDPPATPSKPKRKGGRPSRAEASAKALRGLDLTAIDPVSILRAIAADLSAPASARVAACRALLEQDQEPGDHGGGDTRINARAAAMMRRAN